MSTSKASKFQTYFDSFWGLYNSKNTGVIIHGEILKKLIEFYLEKNKEAFLRTLAEKPDYFYDEYEKVREEHVKTVGPLQVK